MTTPVDLEDGMKLDDKLLAYEDQQMTVGNDMDGAFLIRDARERILKLEEARESDAQIVSAHMSERRLFVRQMRKLEAKNAKLLIAIDLIITHLTGYDLDDEMDAGDFAELNPEAWSIFQEVVAENKDLTTPTK